MTSQPLPPDYQVWFGTTLISVTKVEKLSTKPITKARKDENTKKELGEKDVSCFPTFVFS